MINIKTFDPNLLNIGKILFKTANAVIYDIRYITINTDNENPLYLLFNDADGYIKESHGSKCLIFASTD